MDAYREMLPGALENVMAPVMIRETVYQALDFLSKKRKANEGEVPQYYVEESHDIDREKKNFEMIIREYQSTDCKELTELFYHTVHTVNAKDYTKEQLDVWATGQVNLKKWNQSLQEHFSIVAVGDDVIVGFGDIDKTGYLDRLFVHSDYQGKGIATAICDRLEAAVQENIVAHASITARPFFEKRGYKAVKEQQVERQGIFLTNFVVIKER